MALISKLLLLVNSILILLSQTRLQSKNGEQLSFIGSRLGIRDGILGTNAGFDL